MNKSDIRRLQELTGYPRISILMPTHRSSPDNKRDPIVLDNLLKETEQRLLKEFSRRETGAWMERLRELVGQVDFGHLDEGLAVFAGPDHGEWHKLPFPVAERVVIDETYATRDLVYVFNRSPRYRVLVLSEQPTRLFEGVRADLTEISLGGFPMTYTGPGAGEKIPAGFGIEKSDVIHARMRQFFRTVVQALAGIHKHDLLPVVVTGVERYLAWFDEAAGRQDWIAGTIEGSHDRTPAHDLGKLAWPVMRDWLKTRRDEVRKRMDAATGANRAAAGLQECWRVAGEGRVDTLLVEENYHVAARTDAAGTLVPADDAAAPGVIDDAVDELIEIVIARGGEVVFFAPGRLAERDRIAAILRY